MRLVYVLFTLVFAQGILGKAVTTYDDDEFDFDYDEVREKRSPDFGDEDEDISDDYDSFYESSEKAVPSSDFAIPYEFPKSRSPLRAADATSDTKSLITDLQNLQKDLTNSQNKVKGALDKAKKILAELGKLKAKNAAAAKAAATKAKPAAKPAAAQGAAAKAPAKTMTYNVVALLSKEAYNPKLQQTTSKEYQALGKKLQDACVALYNTAKSKSLFGFKINKITGCGTGVTVDMGLKFDAAAKDPTKKVKDAIKTGKLGGLVIDSTFIKIYTKNGLVCSGACPSATASPCPQVSPVSAYAPAVPAAAPVMYPAPAPVYAPPTPVCPTTCPVSCCAPQPVCPTTCPANCCINQGR